MALLACGGAYWPLAFEPSAMTSRHPYYCGHPHFGGGGGGSAPTARGPTSACLPSLQERPLPQPPAVGRPRVDAAAQAQVLVLGVAQGGHGPRLVEDHVLDAHEVEVVGVLPERLLDLDADGIDAEEAHGHAHRDEGRGPEEPVHDDDGHRVHEHHQQHVQHLRVGPRRGWHTEGAGGGNTE